MSSKTKIVVLRMKEIIYTAIFLGLGILLVTLFLIMFRPGKDAAETSSEEIYYITGDESMQVSGSGLSYTSAASSYVPGIYASTLTLGSQSVNLEVTVDSSQIKSITYTPLSDSVATMYPLVEPAAAAITEQIVATQSLENLTYPDGSRYTSQAIVQAVKEALEKAEVK